MDFYMVASSADSSRMYPGNKAEDFRVNIEEPLIFTSQPERRWAVGLCNISYPSLKKNTPSSDDVIAFSDICQESLLHGAQQPVLKYINGGGSLRKVRGYHSPQVQYRPLKITELRSLRIYLRGDQGKELSFSSGKTTCVLHFKTL
jgi:hypothetical protein